VRASVRPTLSPIRALGQKHIGYEPIHYTDYS
jgi:hypothetical protein